MIGCLKMVGLQNKIEGINGKKEIIKIFIQQLEIT